MEGGGEMNGRLMEGRGKMDGREKRRWMEEGRLHTHLDSFNGILHLKEPSFRGESIDPPVDQHRQSMALCFQIEHSDPVANLKRC